MFSFRLHCAKSRCRFLCRPPPQLIHRHSTSFFHQKTKHGQLLILLLLLSLIIFIFFLLLLLMFLSSIFFFLLLLDSKIRTPFFVVKRMEFAKIGRYLDRFLLFLLFIYLQFMRLFIYRKNFALNLN